MKPLSMFFLCVAIKIAVYRSTSAFSDVEMYIESL